MADGREFQSRVPILVAVSHADAISLLVGDSLRFSLVATALKAISELFDELSVGLSRGSGWNNTEANGSSQADGEGVLHGKHRCCYETGMDLGATSAGSITSGWRATIGRDPSVHRNGIPALHVCLPVLRPKHDDVDLLLLILLFHPQVP